MKRGTVNLIVAAIACLALGACASAKVTAKVEEPSLPEKRDYTQSLHYIAFDKENRMLLGSTHGFVVRLDDISGANLKTYGTWGMGQGQFRVIMGVAVDSKDRIYILDQKNLRLVRVDDMEGNGWKTLDFSSGELMSVGMRSVHIDARDRIYITDEAKHRIVRMDSIEGDNLVSYGTYGTGQGQFASPYTMALDELGRIYVADGGNSRIVRIDDMDGSGWTTFGKEGMGVGEFHRTFGVDLDSKGRIYVSDGGGRLVKIDDMEGSNWEEVRLRDLANGRLFNHAGLKIDKDGKILFPDYTNGRLLRIDSIKGDGYIWYSFEK